MAPKNLTSDQLEMRMEDCPDILLRIEENGEWFNAVITEGENWGFQYNPETTRQLMQWISPG
jgi:hypothetical protein